MKSTALILGRLVLRFPSCMEERVAGRWRIKSQKDKPLNDNKACPSPLAYFQRFLDGL